MVEGIHMSNIPFWKWLLYLSPIFLGIGVIVASMILGGMELGLAH